MCGKIRIISFSGEASSRANTGTTSNGGNSNFLNLWDKKKKDTY